MFRILAAGVLALAPLPAIAQPASVALALRDHRFAPARIEVPVGQKIELHVTNADGTAEEFESPDLRREKLVSPGQQVVIRVGPLRAGSYGFIGEFNPATAHGQIVAK